MSKGNGLPKGWAEASLEEVSVVDWGNTSLTKKAYVEDGKYLAVSAAGCDGRIDFAEHKRHTPVISAIGTCGVVHYPQEDFTAIKNTITLTPREGLIHDGFLFHVLTAVRLPQRGSNQRFIAKGDVQAFCVPIAPLPEQHRIVEKIEELFSDLDAGVSALKRAKVNLKRYRASVLKSAVEGRLTEEWRKEHPQAEDGGMLLDRILRERKEKWEKDQLLKFREKGKEPTKGWESKYKEPLEPDADDLPQLPNEWLWVSLDSVCCLIADIDHNMPKSVERGIKFLSAKDLLNNGTLNLTEGVKLISEEDYQRLSRKATPQRNDIIYSRIGACLGKARLVETDERFLVSYSCCTIRTVIASPRFIARYLDCGFVLRRALAGTQSIGVPDLGLDKIKRFPIPLPPLAEQEQIVLLVEERLSQIDSAVKTIDAELIRSKRLRQSILKRAFEGKLVPQDPKDEPASVLLEQIKASKDTEQPKKKTKKVKAKSK